ncbi:type I-E CRISPR-associated protein Cas6/Cse3/CasE [Sphingomonas silueang]|uniref:type I-E CRISPR-associated protein Cas6/Cse3/CasE n=1 Tax=Sphingomonas silueang TaxID=3156617 RepID=UPI0032B4DB41
MSLHLLRIGVDPRALATFAVARRIDDDDGGYALHAALLARFGDAAPRPFRYLPDHAAGPHLLGYLADPAALTDAAALPATDDLLAHVFSSAPAVRAMPEAWREGARYGFEVRVRPVVRFGRRIREQRAASPGAWQPDAGEMDAYVAACERAVAAGEDWRNVDRESVYVAWLGQRLAPAAALERAGMRLFQRSRTRRSTHRKEGEARRTHRVEGPDAVLAGTLTVTDPAAFAALLAKGVGRHSGFGYGMLLLGPPGRAG